jgi:hypothetical protein
LGIYHQQHVAVSCSEIRNVAMRSVSFRSVYVHGRVSFLKEFVRREVGERGIRVGREVVIPGGWQVKMAEAALRNNVLGADPAEDGPKPQLLHSPGTLANLRRKKLKIMRRI